jgi:apolipoprotein N-acyltransferase
MRPTATTPPAWRRSTFAMALLGSVLLWEALLPVANGWLGWLGWVAPVPWLLLIALDDLPGRRPYRAIYVAGLVFWLLAIHWLILPYPALTWLGWLALSAYLAIYLPAFVGIARVAVHRFDWPLWLAAPVAWTGLELARAHMLTGFLMASLAHTQVHNITLIQISDLVGEYGVDFVIMLVAACLTELLRILVFNPQSTSRSPKSKLRRCILAALPAVLSLAAVFTYGHFRISCASASSSDRRPRVALVQGSIQAEWKLEPGREDQIMREYIRLTERAVREASQNGLPLDLIVWPETMYRSPLRDFDTGFKLPSDATVTTDELVASDRTQLANLARHVGVPILVGIDRIHLVADERSATERPTIQAFNSSALVEPDGKIVGTYDKMHRVMFGEYIPFADWLPFLYRITPLTGGIIAGTEPAALRTSTGYLFAPNICYETAIPHVIRRQVATLDRRGEHPDALVNLTNDAWYWRSSELDMHLACDVFRAVETRVPIVVAANGGISASIDCFGRIRNQLGKQVSDVLVVDVEPGFKSSWYVRFGDWFAGLCLFACIFFAMVEWRTRRSLRRRSIRPASSETIELPPFPSAT